MVSSTTKTLSPSKLAHVVLRTANLAPMITFYTTFLGAHITYQSASLAFLTYDTEHHRIALIAVPGTTPKQPKSCGLDHIAFTFDSLSDLLLAYRQRKSHGITPLWSVNHGPTTSIYYRDPDGNEVETQVENFGDMKGAEEFIASEDFEENPIGVDFDPEEWIRRLEGGEGEEVLMARERIGKRGLPEHML